jgi:hypothetical protein
MGFFSRFFGTDKLDKADSSLSRLPDSLLEPSELGLDAQSAAAVLAEIDIDTAIAAHENWKLRLQNVLDGKSSEELRPELVCLDDRCDLGKWLHGPGGQRLGKYPAFTVLVARHKYFHVQASNVLALAQSGEAEKAAQTLGSSYRHASNQVVLMLKELKRGLGR